PTSTQVSRTSRQAACAARACSPDRADMRVPRTPRRTKAGSAKSRRTTRPAPAYGSQVRFGPEEEPPAGEAASGCSDSSSEGEAEASFSAGVSDSVEVGSGPWLSDGSSVGVGRLPRDSEPSA